MSGGPHSQHGRAPPVAQPGPPAAWNHLQVPPFYAGRQPQHVHMPDHHLLAPRPPTWHTPSTEAVTPLFSLQQMLGSDRAAALAYSRPPAASVDLSLPPRSTHSPRNSNGSNQNGESNSPISLSVRDAKQINSLAERRQTFQELVNPKRPKRVDSILERLNTGTGSVIVSAAHSSHDESSNGSQPGIITSSPLTREEEVLSPASNEDSLDSAKSRRKRKPSKTVRMSKDDKHSDEENKHSDENLLNLTKTDSNASVDLSHPTNDKPPRQAETNDVKQPPTDVPPVLSAPQPESAEQPVIVMRRSSSESAIPDNENSSVTVKKRRKTLSESETIENIAAMIASTELEKEKIGSESNSKPSSPDTGSKVNLENVLASPPPSENLQPEIIVPNPESESVESKVETVVEAEVNTKQPAEEITPIVENKEPPVLNNEPVNDDFSQKMTESSSFVEVENQLEKMFAGLDEMDTTDATAKQDPSTSQSSTERERVTSTSSEVGGSVKKKTIRKKSARSRSSKTNKIRRASDEFENSLTKKLKIGKNKILDDPPTSSFNSLHKISLKGTKTFQKAKIPESKILIQKQKTKTNENVQKDIYAYDSGSNASSIRSRGPFIQIRGPRDSPISVNIVNTPSTGEEDGEKTQRMKLTKKSFHDDSEYRNKVRSKGLHSSTLSIKYDAHTTDMSWICVFCKRGPHTTANDINNHQPGPSTGNISFIGYSSGDLFGPYVITSDCPEYQQSLEQMNEAKIRQTEHTSTAYTGKFSNKKAKKRHLQNWSGSSSVLSSHDLTPEYHSSASMEGMIESAPNRYEIWMHEDCIVWGPGVYLAGPRIVGLEGAVWSCCSVVCVHCQKRGASVSCLVRNCGLVSHVGCAKLSGWHLDEETYKAYCQRHKKLT